MEAQAVHLFNLAHFKPFNPILSLHAVNADKFACVNALVYPAHFSHCLKCGTLRVCGLTASYYISYSKRKKLSKDAKSQSTSLNALKTKPRDRHLNVRCLHCGHVEKSPLLNKKEKKESELGPKLESKRKKKKSQLLALLERKRQQEKNPKPTLDLMAFMQ